MLLDSLSVYLPGVKGDIWAGWGVCVWWRGGPGHSSGRSFIYMPAFCLGSSIIFQAVFNFLPGRTHSAVIARLKRRTLTDVLQNLMERRVLVDRLEPPSLLLKRQSLQFFKTHPVSKPPVLPHPDSGPVQRPRAGLSGSVRSGAGRRGPALSRSCSPRTPWSRRINFTDITSIRGP